MGNLLDAYNATTSAATERGYTRDVDAALVEAGRTIAERVDDAVENGEGQDVTKALYLIPHMLNVLREMHATPKARHDAGLDEGGATVSKIGKFRAVAGGKSA